jgi:hypothetical protein
MVNLQDNARGVMRATGHARYNRSNRVRRNQPKQKEKLLAEDKVYRAEYVGSGTFIISKPKRKKQKMRQTALRNPQRGSRK